MQLPTISYKLISKLFSSVQQASDSQKITFVANKNSEIEKPRYNYICIQSVYLQRFIYIDIFRLVWFHRSIGPSTPGGQHGHFLPGTQGGGGPGAGIDTSTYSRLQEV